MDQLPIPREESRPSGHCILVSSHQGKQENQSLDGTTLYSEDRARSAPIVGDHPLWPEGLCGQHGPAAQCAEDTYSSGVNHVPCDAHAFSKDKRGLTEPGIRKDIATQDDKLCGLFIS